MLFDSSYTTPASTTWKRVEANQTYWPKHNLQIGSTLLSSGLPSCYLRLCCFDVCGHRHDLQSRTTDVSTIRTALALVAGSHRYGWSNAKSFPGKPVVISTPNKIRRLWIVISNVTKNSAGREFRQFILAVNIRAYLCRPCQAANFTAGVDKDELLWNRCFSLNGPAGHSRCGGAVAHRTSDWTAMLPFNSTDL